MKNTIKSRDTSNNCHRLDLQVEFISESASDLFQLFQSDDVDFQEFKTKLRAIEADITCIKAHAMVAFDRKRM